MKKIFLLLLFLLAVVMSNYYYLTNYIHVKGENYATEQIKLYYQPTAKASIYQGILHIPKINLTRGFLDIDDEDNDVDKNIMVIRGSAMPDQAGTSLILAGHNGNGSASYFKNLSHLEIGDKLYINYQNKLYTYQLFTIYDEKKDGFLAIRQYARHTQLVLITCKDHTKDWQTVYIAWQI